MVDYPTSAKGQGSLIVLKLVTAKCIKMTEPMPKSKSCLGDMQCSTILSPDQKNLPGGVFTVKMRLLGKSPLARARLTVIIRRRPMYALRTLLP